MYPHPPHDRPGFESAEWMPPEPRDDHTRIEERTRFASTSSLVTILIGLAIVLMIVLL